jgi:hypothetical protein
MAVENVEFVRPLANLFHQQHRRRHGIAQRRVEAKGAGPHSVQFGTRYGIAAGEQRYVMAHGHEFLCKE